MKGVPLIGLMTLALITAGPLQASPVTGSLAEQQEGQSAQTPQQQLADSIVQLSGLTGLSLQARNLAQQVLNEEQAALGFQYQVASRVSSLWSPEPLTRVLKEALQPLDETSRQTLLEALNHQLMQQAREKENSAVVDQDTKGFLAYVQKLRRQPPAASRLQVITELDQAMHFSKLLMNTRASVFAQLQAVLQGWQPPANWQQTMRNESREFLLYTYRRTPNDGIQALTRLYRDAALQQWLQAVQQRLSRLDPDVASAES